MVILIAIMIVLAFISLLLSKRIKTTKDYMIGGGQIPLLVVALSMAATQFGGTSLIGGIQQGAKMGFWPGMYPIIGMALALVGASIVGPKYKKVNGAVTPPDFMEARYGKSNFLRMYHSATYILTLLAMSTSQIIAFAQLASSFGINYNTAVWICTTAIILFTLLSGMWGVAVTDALQFGVILILLPIVGGSSLGALQQSGSSFSSLVSEPVFSSESAFSAFMYSTVPIIFGTMINYDTFTRYQSAKNSSSIRKASLIGACALAFLALPIGLMGSAVNRLFFTTSDADVMNVLISNVLPTWVGYIFAAVVMMALLTSADSFMASISTGFTRDFYQKVISNKNQDCKKSLLISRISLVIATIASGVAATHFSSIIKVAFYFSPLTTGVLFAPMIFGVFWKKASKTGTIISVICSIMLAICHIFNLFIFIDRTLGVMIVGVVCLVVFSLIFPDKSEKQADKSPV